MEKELGPEAKLKLEIVAGKLKFSTDYAGKQLEAGAYISTSADQLCDALAVLIPGDTSAEAIALSVLRATLKSVAV